MVMPRSRSISMLSSIWSRNSRSEMPPQRWISLSARVDLPWSIWAMIAKLRIWARSVIGSREEMVEVPGGIGLRHLHNRARPQHRHAGGRERALGEDEVARHAQHLAAPLEPGAARGGRHEVPLELHGGEEAMEPLLEVGAESERHVGKRHQHAAVA